MFKLLWLAAAFWCFWRAFSRRPDRPRPPRLRVLAWASLGVLLVGANGWGVLTEFGRPCFQNASPALLAFCVVLDWARAGLLLLALVLMFRARNLLAGPSPRRYLPFAALLLFGVAIAMAAIGSRIYTPRLTVAVPSCAHRLMTLNMYAWEWAQERQLPKGTPITAEWRGQILDGGRRCPRGGTYTLDKVGDPPACSLHSEPRRVPTWDYKELVFAWWPQKPVWRTTIARKYLLWQESAEPKFVWQLTNE